MAYFDISRLRQDTEFLDRAAACYSVETPLGEGEDPTVWATVHAWDLASAPGFGDKYGSALAGGVEHPGADPSVIADSEILSAVQFMINSETGA